jgi:hypothetical protein
MAASFPAVLITFPVPRVIIPRTWTVVLNIPYAILPPVSIVVLLVLALSVGLVIVVLWGAGGREVRSAVILVTLHDFHARH